MKVFDLKLAVVVLCILISSCASGRYISNPAEPEPKLDISSADNDLSVTVDYLIIPGGKGAWVKGARWDEYVLTVRNMRNKPVDIEQIRVIDPRGLYIEGGVDPYQLETQSEQMASAYKEMGISLAIAEAPFAVGAFSAAMPFAYLSDAFYSFRQVKSQKDSEAIQAEFKRRRLGTFTLSGNATITGSAFFPIVPDPQALVINYAVGNKSGRLKLPLNKLKGLHVASSEKNENKAEHDKKETSTDIR